MGVAGTGHCLISHFFLQSSLTISQTARPAQLPALPPHTIAAGTDAPKVGGPVTTDVPTAPIAAPATRNGTQLASLIATHFSQQSKSYGVAVCFAGYPPLPDG